MRTKFFITLIFIVQIVTASGQTNENAQKAVETFNKGDREKGIKMMEKVMKKDGSQENWDIIVSMYYNLYEHKKNVTSQLLLNMLTSKKNDMVIVAPTVYFNQLVNKCREAGLNSQSVVASQILRNLFVDYNPDTAVSKEANDEFLAAEDYFIHKDYENAKITYKKALALHPDFYKAIIYLGDSYWYLEQIDSAIYYFQKGIEINPTLLEPKKYLVDALAFAQRNKEAKSECFNALFLYPDESMFIKYSDLLKRENKKFNKHWVKRECEINTIAGTETESSDVVWSAYQNAEKSIKAYCDSSGIITKENDVTKAKYLEVYSWEKMLSSTSLPEDLLFAKKMMDEGYLDCYVFVSAFHFDFYNQYNDFVKNNKDRIKTYVKTYLVE